MLYNPTSCILLLAFLFNIPEVGMTKEKFLKHFVRVPTPAAVYASGWKDR
jgi:hypothetical protein